MPVLFGSCLNARESPNERWNFVIQRVQSPLLELLLAFSCSVKIVTSHISSEVFFVFVEVDQSLVQEPTEQFEIIQTSLDTDVFLQPIVYVIQHVLDFVVAKSQVCNLASILQK